MPKTLLLADDSVTIQKVVGISFASEDIAITTVDNGNDALAKAREIRPDVILADVVMPGLSGYEVCEAIKAEPGLAHIPVLLLTGTFEAFDEARASAAGASGHVAKPFEAQTLVDRVRALLEAPPAPAPAPAPEVAPAAAAPAASATDDAFDFFSDDEAAAPEVAAAGPDAAGDDAFSDGPLDLDGPDAAFAFDDDDLAPSAQEPLASPPLSPAAPDATVAILPDSPAASTDPLDFSFDEREAPEPTEAPLPPDALAHTALLDPVAAADLDVSSSDLEVDLASGPAAAPGARPRSDDDFDLTEPEPLPLAPPSPLGTDPVMEALAPSDAAEPPRPFGAAPDPGDTLPRGGGRPAVPIEAEDAPLEAEPLHADPLDVELEAEPIADAAPEPTPMPAGAAASSGAQAVSLSPAMREELRDTLEKIAWDAFGQVTEKVVREAIERIERAAWEVVPKLAETLIQEEIRRLKGGNS